MTTDENGVTIPIVPLWERPGWTCPACGGLGHLLDGWEFLSCTEHKSKPATTCSQCNGKGRVNISPIED